jgi:hypothetical protein
MAAGNPDDVGIVELGSFVIKMKRLPKVFANCVVGVLATIGLIAVVNEIRNPRPWWIARWPAIADSNALIADCERLLDQYGTNYYARVNGGARLIVDRPPSILVLNAACVDVVLDEGVIIQLHPGKGPTYGYIVVPYLKEAFGPTLPSLPSGLLQNGRYIGQTGTRGIYTFEDTRDWNSKHPWPPSLIFGR